MEASAAHGPSDLIFAATGHGPIVFAAAEAPGKKGVLILSTVPGGDTMFEANTDRIGRGFVLGNKSVVGTVNASRKDFLAGVDDRVRAKSFYPGWPNC